MTPDVCAGKVEGLPGARGRLLAKAEADTWPMELKSGQAEFGVVRFAPPPSAGANWGWGQCESAVWPHSFRGCFGSGLAWATPWREQVSHARAGGHLGRSRVGVGVVTAGLGVW
ncbi:unnamed protein product [Rangifer tarandus platyrhynchus]|uniref:Uncharacterized protein n=2 Tax=Rangifer tarandus platyrhynchus TaxID=3082113 RepID=A0ABN8ZPU5_RANTA|nr:unnamed protein product [Rangifer tarandus platyrhynchus]